jgi:hypothetical protein
MVFTLIGDSTMNNLVWVFFSMAAISTPTPCQSALADPSQTFAMIGKQERLDKPGVRACVMRAREVALRNCLRGVVLLIKVWHMSNQNPFASLGDHLTRQMNAATQGRSMAQPEPVTFESFTKEFINLVNNSETLASTREALILSFACMNGNDFMRASMWLDFTYSLYDRTIAFAVEDQDFEMGANAVMFHGIIRSILGKQNFDEAFQKSFEFGKNLNDPILAARCTEEYAWALNHAGMTSASAKELERAESQFRACGRNDRADEIVRLRDGGQPSNSSFLRRKSQSPEATTVLGSSDAKDLRLYIVRR